MDGIFAHRSATGDVTKYTYNSGTNSLSSFIWLMTSSVFPQVVDQNGDGVSDLRYYNSGSMYNYLLNSSGSSISSGNWHITTTLIPNPGATVDLNLDGSADYVGQQTGVIRNVLLNNTATAFSSFNWIVDAGTFNLRFHADLNGDGRKEAVTMATGSPNPTGVLKYSFNANAYGSGLHWMGDTDVPIGAGDFNGDGIADLLVWNQSTSTLSVRYVTSDALGSSFSLNSTVSLVTEPGFAITGNYPKVAVVDLNADGRSDMLVRTSSDQIYSVITNSTGTGAASPVWLTQIPSGSWMRVGDITGDNRADLIYKSAANNDLIVVRFSSAGTAVAGTHWFTNMGSNIPVAPMTNAI
jgi:hypothetical protein